MSSRWRQLRSPLAFLLVAGLLAAGAFAWWQVVRARQAARAMAQTLEVGWPEQSVPRTGTRDQLLAAARNMEQGRFGRVVAALGRPKSPTAAERTQAQRFFAQHVLLRGRFIAAADSARLLEADGADVAGARDALARALVSATKRDAENVDHQIGLAEQAQSEADLITGGARGPGDAQSMAALVRGIGPAYRMGADLMTQGHAAASKVLARASDLCRDGEMLKASGLVRLAAELLGADTRATADADLPAWFEELTSAPEDSIGSARAEAEVKLAEAIASSQSPGEPVDRLVKVARRELEIGRLDEAHWWAGVALNGLGMTDEAIRAATQSQDAGTAE